MFSVFLHIFLIVAVTGNKCNRKFNYEDYYDWWGPEELKNNTNDTIVQFKITFEDDMIENLRFLLKNHGKLTPAFKDSGFIYGTNSNYLEKLASYWADEYDFKEGEKRINKFDHYYTYIQGLKIHFVRYRTNVHRSNTTVLPLLVLHGWPGSVLEFFDAMTLIESKCLGKDFDFDIIVPSLPGFGYSDGAQKPGLGVNEASVIMRNLMKKLGFKKYYVQGGDWGAVVGSIMAVLFCDEVLAYHTNFPLAFTLNSLATYIYGMYNPDSVVDKSLSHHLYPASDVLAFYLQETGYFHVQASKPDTIGHALSSSPIAFLGWITQAISSQIPYNIGREDGGVEMNLSRNKILDNAMLYWSTGKITTSARFYAESMRKKSLGSGLQAAPVIVPTWAVQAKYEYLYMTEEMLKSRFINLVNVTILDKGTHMLAWDNPEGFAQSVVDAITEFRDILEAATTCG